MKHLICIFLTCLLAAAACTGCVQQSDGVDGNDDRLDVVATIFAPYDFAREIAGERAAITMLLPPASESHSFEPSPKDIIRIRNCDVFIYVGGESDEWVRIILDSMDTDGMKIIALMDCVDAVEEEIVEGMESEEVEEGVAYDEHVWTSPRNARLIVQRITEALCASDVANASAYAENADAYIEKLNGLDAMFKEVIEKASRKTIIFGDRFPFRYFADAYELEYFAAFPGCASETEPSAATIAFLIKKVREENIPVIFHAELSNGKIAETVSEATGAKVLLFHACHNISKDDFQNGLSYLELMTRNAEALKEALA